MTISTTESSITYTGNGVTLAFAVPFRFLVNGDLAVVLRSTTGAETTQILSTNYSLTGAGDDAGGTLTMFTAPAVDEKLVIRRVVAITQETDYITGDSFPAETHERALDRLTMIAQQHDEGINRSIQFPVSDTASPVIPTSATRANKFLAFDSDGNATVATGTTSTGTPISALGETLVGRGTAALMRGDLGSTTVGDAVFTATSREAARAAIDVPHRNYIDNPAGPAGIVYQRTVAATADDAYYFDRWYSLSQTGTVTPSTLSAPETGFAQGFRVTQSQVSAQRYGFAQILPNDYVRELVSGNASLSLRARISNTTTLRWALLGWSGTADAVTSDVVNDWTSVTYTTGNFFITGGGSLSVIATGNQAMTANTFATLATSGAAIGASSNNLILFCWTDSTQAQNTTLDWHDARLTKTDVRVPVITRSLYDELIKCMGDSRPMVSAEYILMQDVTNAQQYTHGFSFGLPFKRTPANPTLTNNMTGFGAPSLNTISKTHIAVSAIASATAAARVFSFSGYVSADL